MQLRKVIERKLRLAGRGVDVESDVHSVVAANVGERGSVTSVSSQQTATATAGAATPEQDRNDAA